MEPLLRGTPTGNTIGDLFVGESAPASESSEPERSTGTRDAGPEPEQTLEPTMKMIFIAGIMITLPAIVIVLAFFGRAAMWPAFASFAVNMLPFIAMMFLLRGRKGNQDDFGH